MSFSIEDPGFLKRGRRNARTGKKNVERNEETQFWNEF